MPYELQVKLLRVLQEKTFIPVGGIREKQVDVRVLSATSTDLQAKILANQFRKDIYFRLSEFEVWLPPLRERVEDIPLLVEHFLHRLSTDLKIERPRLTPEALAALMSYHFPGNVRELKKILMRALIESEGQEIQPEHLFLVHTPDPIPATTPGPQAATIDLPLNLQRNRSGGRVGANFS